MIASFEPQFMAPSAHCALCAPMYTRPGSVALPRGGAWGENRPDAECTLRRESWGLGSPTRDPRLRPRPAAPGPSTDDDRWRWRAGGTRTYAKVQLRNVYPRINFLH